jgi:hypothetical protein
MWIAGAALCLLAGCGKSSNAADDKGQSQPPAKVAAAGGDALCKLLTTEEVVALIGPVTGTSTGSVEVPGLSTCIWKTADYRTMLTVTVKDVSDNPGASQLPLKKGEGFRMVPELGADGFVEKSGGWLAGATHGKAFVSVLVSSPKADADQAIHLLAEVIKRRG